MQNRWAQKHDGMYELTLHAWSFEEMKPAHELRQMGEHCLDIQPGHTYGKCKTKEQQHCVQVGAYDHLAKDHIRHQDSRETTLCREKGEAQGDGGK